MADDVIWDYVTDYIEGRIPREVFKSYCDFRKPTHQIVFHNKNILDKYLKYVGYERV